MEQMISEGIMVKVETFYQPDYSNPLQHEFMHAYRITIENHNYFPVKLTSRHWHICDGNGERREIEGEGVVGIQPVITPGDKYQYVSGCNLHTEIGIMYGSYRMTRMDTQQLFDVCIPKFTMETPAFKN